MKKILCIILASLMVFSLAACGNNNSNTEPNKPNDNISHTTPNKENDNGAMKPSDDKEELKYPLDELKPDGSISVDLDSEQVIYDKNDIKVTYKGYSESYWGYDLNVVVENNGFDNLNFIPYNAVVNGMTFGTGCDISEPMTKGETKECVISVYTNDLALSKEDETEIFKDGIKCFDLYFGFYDGDNVYGATKTMIDNNVVYSFTKGEHDHRNDSRMIKGELIYENDEMAIYLGKTFEEIPDKYYSEMTIINKTSKTIMVGSHIECIYTSAPIRQHFTSILGLDNYIAPNSYVTGKVYIDEEHSELDMVEIIMKKQCYYATIIDVEFNEDDCIDDEGHEGLEKMNCFYDRITVPITVIKEK